MIAPHVAVVGSLEPLLYSVSSAAAAAGRRVQVWCPAPSAPTLRRSQRIAEAHPADLVPGETPSPLVMQGLAAEWDAAGIDVVVPADYHATVALAQLAVDGGFGRARAFPVPTPQAIFECNDKWWLAELCRSLDLDIPATRRLDTMDDVADATRLGRIVVKPPSEGFGAGVRILDDADELIDHVTDSGREANELPLLVQEFVPGIDIDVTVLADHGEVIADVVQYRDGNALRFVDDQRSVDMVRPIAEATGFHGVMDFDLRLDRRADRLVVIECNPRLPGSLINKTFVGLDLVDLGCRLAMGAEVTSPARPVGVTRSPQLGDLRSMVRPAWWAEENRGVRAAWRHAVTDPAWRLAARATG